MKCDKKCARVSFVLAISLGVLLLWMTTLAMGESTENDMRAKRKELAQRPRRIMYNDDGLDIIPYKTPEELIALRVRQVKDTQVDTICYCTGGSGMFWGHQSRVGESLGEFVYDTSDQYVKDARDGLIALKELGTDPLEVVVDYGHKNNMEVFWSCRMNNIEDSFVPWCHPRWKREHPEYLFGVASDWDASKYDDADTRIWWSAMDFARPEVRDYVFRIIEDVCQRYDIDGIDLDFLRHPMFFRPTVEGRPAAPRHVAMMTDLVRRIRAMTERIAIERGRPLLVSVRTPLTVERSLAIGLDIKAYLKEDLADILIVGDDYGTLGVASYLKKMTDLGHQYQVQVYSLLNPPNYYVVESGEEVLAAWRGAAMNRWYWGADGIYIFNLFPREPDERFSQLGSVETLKGLDKTYALDCLRPEMDRMHDENGKSVPYSVLGCFRAALVLPNKLPVVLAANDYVTIKLSVGEDIVANTPAGKTVSVLLRLKVSSMVEGDSLTVKFNGHPLGSPNPVEPLTSTPQRARFELSVDPKQVKPGYNLIDVQLATEQTATIMVDFLDLMVSYK